MKSKYLIRGIIVVVCIVFGGLTDVSASQLGINQDCADFTYFHSKHYNVGTNEYKNTIFTAEENTSYTVEPADYKNAGKGESIIFVKTNAPEQNSVYFKTDLTKRTECWPQVDHPYSYYYLDGDFKANGSLLKWNMISLYDGSNTINLCLDKNTLRCGSSNLEFVQTVTAYEWHHILALFNIEEHKADIFFDEKYIGSFLIDAAIKRFDTAECRLYGGAGSIEMKNWEFTGIVKPYRVEKVSETEYKPIIEHSSVFPDDTVIKEYLDDKVVFHGEGGLIYKNGKKTPLNEYEYTDDELFASVNEINKAMGLNLSIDKNTGTLVCGEKTYELPKGSYGDYLPVSETLSMLGYYSSFAKYGKMVIASSVAGILLEESEFKEESGKYASGIAIYRQRGFLKTDVVDNEHGTSMIIGMDENCDTERFNNNQYTYVQHKIDRTILRNIYEFDINVLSAPVLDEQAVRFAVRYTDGSTQTLMSVRKSQLQVSSARSEYHIKAWYHVKADIISDKWYVTITDSDGAEVMTGNGEFSSTKIKDQFRFHTYINENNRYSVAIDNISVKRENDLIDCKYNPSWFDGQYYSKMYDYPILNFSDAEEISNYIFFDRPTAVQLQSDLRKNVNIGEHPRLMVNSEDVKRLKRLKATDKKFSAFADKLISSANSYLNSGLPSYKFDDGFRTLSNANSVTLQNTTIAMAYLLTGDTKYSDRVISALMEICNFPDLNAKHIIDTGVWLRGIALSYDWCYNEMTDEQRAVVAEFINREGIEPIRRAYYSMNPAGAGGRFQQVNWFPRWKSNYIPFVQGD